MRIALYLSNLTLDIIIFIIKTENIILIQAQIILVISQEKYLNTENNTYVACEYMGYCAPMIPSE